jgi:hypothetical protein
MITRSVSRRAILRGAGGIGLCLPWLEALAPSKVEAAAIAPMRRYMNMYFPNGTGSYWLPPAPGMGAAWTLSGILEPLLPSKANLLVLDNVGNYSAYGNLHAEPSHGTNCGPSFHGYESRMIKGITDAAPGGGISVDQVIAAQIGSLTPLPSLQVGLSTIDSSCDGSACAHSRSMSWSGPNKPLYKTVNPQAIFDTLVMAGAPKAGMTLAPTPTNPMMPDPALERQRLLKKSVLDAVLDSAASLQPKLSMADKVRVDQYLTSVRDLEKLVANPAMAVHGGGPTLSCTGMPRPPQAITDLNAPPGYSRETHMNLMIQLVTMAFACDLTRTVTFMMDDSRSEFAYTHVPLRTFAGTTSTLAGGVCNNYHGAQHGSDQEFSTIIRWMAEKANQMAQALAGIKEGTGTVLDNTVIHFGSGMHGGNHDGLRLPIALIGSGGGVLKQNGFLALTGDAPPTGARLMNLHLTLIQKVFGSPVTSFGNPGASTGIIPAILA